MMKKGTYLHCESDKAMEAPTKRNTAYYMLCSTQSRFIKHRLANNLRSTEEILWFTTYSR